jgi:hypothetical protein
MDTGDAGGLSAADRREALWKTLLRYDFYIGTTITRAAAVATINALLVGVLAAKAGEIVRDVLPNGLWRVAAGLLLFGCGGLALAGAALSFWAVVPYLGSGSAVGRSLLFFGDVAGRDRAEHAVEVADRTNASLTSDLEAQVHEVATAVAEKFALLRRATQSTVGALLLAFVILGLVVFVPM